MSTQTIPEKLCWPKLPLAVYREIAAHLRQVSGVEVEILPQTDTHFDYELSQVGGLQIRRIGTLSPTAQHQILQILQYYRKTLGDWQEPFTVESGT
jgi:hypothetical protein